ncbi:VC0807 family protein [Paenibacillus oryzisoli]|uniref:VC0807 family protein n=1 Tax=Paenibacillus oryzisoli TaxID=1850517 RepID=UPI003D2CC6A0
MSQHAQHKFNSTQLIKKIVPSLAVNWLAPLLIYNWLCDAVASDTAALAISACVPVVWVIATMLKTRRVDWIGVMGIAGLGVALALSMLTGGGSLPLKLYHPLITGTIGLAFAGSALAKKPLLLTVLRAAKMGNTARFADRAVHRKLTAFSLLLGLGLMLDAALHVVLAFTLTTGAFLVVSRCVTVGLLLLLLVVRWSLQRNK